MLVYIFCLSRNGFQIYNVADLDWMTLFVSEIYTNFSHVDNSSILNKGDFYRDGVWVSDLS